MKCIDTAFMRKFIKDSLKEDSSHRDITTSLIDHAVEVEAVITSRRKTVLAGMGILSEVFRQVDRGVCVKNFFGDGSVVGPGKRVASVSGRAGSILRAERTALNFLGRLSGIATLTRWFVDQTRGSGCGIYDTRKTTPLFRAFEKYAVRVGGGNNHRFSLADMVLFKDNHWAVAGHGKQEMERLMERIKDFRKKNRGVPVEIEADTLVRVRLALSCSADIIMLDNMGLSMMKRAISMIRRSPAGRSTIIEISGGVTAPRVKLLASIGADRISAGSLIHSASSSDFSLKIRKRRR